MPIKKSLSGSGWARGLVPARRAVVVADVVAPALNSSPSADTGVTRLIFTIISEKGKTLPEGLKSGMWQGGNVSFCVQGLLEIKDTHRH